MGAIIREAVLDDAAAIARVHVEAWRVGYRGMMPDAFLAALDEKTREARWRTTLQAASDDGKKLLVAIADDALVGFAGVGPLRPVPSAECGELYAINIEPSAWGSGVASDLLRTATRTLASLGYGEAILWCLRANARARRFYEREGWLADGGEVKKDITEAGITLTLDEVRYRQRLPA